MDLTKFLIITITLAIILTTCDGFIQNWLPSFFGSKKGRRSLSEVITNYLDEVFPKDDKESRTMKQIFMMLSDDGNKDMETQLEGIEFLLE